MSRCEGRARAEAPPRDALFWHYPHYGNQGGTPACSVRAGDWKLVEWFETGRIALFIQGLLRTGSRKICPG